MGPEGKKKKKRWNGPEFYKTSRAPCKTAKESIRLTGKERKAMIILARGDFLNELKLGTKEKCISIFVFVF